MAICKTCGREMLEAAGCLPRTPIVLCGFEEVPQATPEGDRCRDCGATYGHPHHTFCCVEDCPRCHAQLLSCNCPKPYPAEGRRGSSGRSSGVH